MILSTNIIDKENDDNDSSSDSSIKDEGLAELKNIMDNNKKSNSYNFNFILFRHQSKSKKCKCFYERK